MKLDGHTMARDSWLWCVHCGRLMRACDVVVSGGGYTSCPFENCDGAGVGIDLWPIHEGESSAQRYPAIAERESGAFVGW